MRNFLHFAVTIVGALAAPMVTLFSTNAMATALETRTTTVNRAGNSGDCCV